MSTTNIPSGTCLIHGAFYGQSCPSCSTSCSTSAPMTPSPEQPEHEEARRLAGKLLTENERKLAKASWAYGVVADPNIPKWGNLVLEAYDAAAALLSKAEQERDDLKQARDEAIGVALMHRDERDAADIELERLREALNLAGQWVADAADRGDQIAEADLARIHALSADTQREDG